MTLDKVLCRAILFSLLASTVHKTQELFTIDGGNNQQNRVGYVIYA